MVDPSKIPETIAAIEKRYDKNTIFKGSEYQRVPRIPFPSIELNIATGGGIPLGRATRIFGEFSSGKTLTCLNTIRNAQNLHLIAQEMIESDSQVVKRKGQYLLDKFPNGLEVAYYNVEGVYDKEFAQRLGVDTDRLYVIDGTVIEKIGTVLEGSLGAIHMHIIDTASAASSVDELKAKIEDWHRGIKARAWGKVIDHLQEHMDKTENSVIFVDQVRVDQQTGAFKAAGGKKMEHLSALTIKFKKGAWLFDRGDGTLVDEKPKTSAKATIHGDAEPDGFKVDALVTKSRVGRQNRVARLQLRHDTNGFDQEYELEKAATWLKVVDKNGSWYSLNGDKFQGRKKLIELINDRPDLQKQINDRVIEYTEENP